MNINTRDIVLAAFLKCKGAQLDEITIDGTKGIFHLSNVSQEDVAAFDTGRGMVEPNQLNSNIKQLSTACRRMNEPRY